MTRSDHPTGTDRLAEAGRPARLGERYHHRQRSGRRAADPAGSDPADGAAIGGERRRHCHSLGHLIHDGRISSSIPMSSRSSAVRMATLRVSAGADPLCPDHFAAAGTGVSLPADFPAYRPRRAVRRPRQLSQGLCRPHGGARLRQSSRRKQRVRCGTAIASA